MRLVHLSDLHLGFRAFSRTDRGWNLRERDVASAFRWALQEITRIEPDLVLLTGDIFDHPDPPSTAFLTLHRSLALLRAQLPQTSVLMIAGERDTPVHPAMAGPVAVLDTWPGVEAAAGAARAVRFRKTGVHALLVPYRATARPPFPDLKPDPGARWNILLIRGDLGRTTSEISLDLGGWNYVAVGGGHRPERPASNLWVAGSVERPGGDPWRGATEERGFVSFDLEAGVGEFHPVPGRPVVDLAPVRVSSSNPEPGTRRLRELVEGIPGGIEGKIVRIRLVGDVLAPVEGVSEGLLAALRAQAAHLEVRLSGDDSGSLRAAGHSSADSERSPPWRPSGLLVNRLPDPEARMISLRPGLVLLTSESEVVRNTLARELRGAVQKVEGGGGSYGLVIDPPVPSEIARLWAGELDAVDPEIPERKRVSGEEGASPSSSGSNPVESNPDLTEQARVLRDLRADAVEAAGDLEARTLGWARDRQDAESHLRAYRERAQELRDRLRTLEELGEPAPCPTCGRVLGERHEEMLRALKGEWEAVVQDGKWWRKRREQLDHKPTEIQKLEQAALRAQAEVEAAAEGLEGLRLRLRHLSIGEEPGEAALGKRGKVVEPLGQRTTALLGSREFLQTVSDLLIRFTEGRLTGVRPGPARLDAMGCGGSSGPPIGRDRIALELAVQVAMWQRSRLDGGGASGLLLWRLHESGTEELALRVLSTVGEVVPSETVVLAVVPPSVMDRMPDAYREGLIFGTDERERLAVRRVSGGRVSLGLLSSGDGAGSSAAPPAHR